MTILAAVLLTLASPNGQVTLTLESRPALMWSVALKGKPALEPSAVGMTLNGVLLAEGAKPGKAGRGLAGPCSTAELPFTGKTPFTLQLRACNGGAAYRHMIPAGEAHPRVPDEASSFRPPAGSMVWFHDLEGHYEALHKQRGIAEIAEGEWAAPPVTYRLPDGSGYASITEAALYRYAGMALQSDGSGAFLARLGHAHPPSYPFRLRYKDDVERLKQPAAVEGPITTPWRAVLTGSDLNELVNSTLIAELSPPPDSKLFPQGAKTAWIKPGRAVWKYLDGGQNDAATVREFSRLAAELGFEYQVVEGFWQKWSADELKQVIAESRQRGVGLILWKHSSQLRTPEARQQFFDLIAAAGAAGAKIDFFDHEAKEIVELYEVLLREAAQRKLLVNFHGANKPTGECFTWPNELTREAVRGMESRKSQRARHDATLPFTRFLAGPADYTPVHFGERRNDTTWAHQLATAVVLGSPLLTYAAHPKSLLENPAVELIKAVPAVWDETRVLPPSAIGEVAVLARRRGADWFIAAVNGTDARRIDLNLDFLGGGDYEALAAADKPGEPAAIDLRNKKVNRSSKLAADLAPGGGCLVRLTPLRSSQP